MDNCHTEGIYLKVDYRKNEIILSETLMKWLDYPEYVTIYWGKNIKLLQILITDSGDPLYLKTKKMESGEYKLIGSKEYCHFIAKYGELRSEGLYSMPGKYVEGLDAMFIYTEKAEQKLDENVITFYCTEEEKQILTDVFAQYGWSIEQATNEFLRWVIREPDTAAQWLKQTVIEQEEMVDDELLRRYRLNYSAYARGLGKHEEDTEE